jgi:hypothetical protein
VFDTDGDGICDTADPFPTTDDATLDLSDFIGSWKLTALTGAYVYTVNLPDGNESGVTWANTDTSFGIKARWDMADAIFTGAYASFTEYGNQWLLEVQSGDTIPAVTQTTTIPSVDFLAGAGIGLIGVFEDAPSAGAYATYKMKGVYPGIFYNYTLCASAGSTAPMTDQGLYNWNQSATANNFVIKRDPSISGSQVLPPFEDGTLTLVDENTANIQFLDRDSHSTLYAEIMDTWDEGTHPSLSIGGINSEGDRTYVGMGTVLPIGPSPDGYGDIFYASSVGATGTGTIGSDPVYIYNPALSNWGNYMTYNAWIFNIEMGYRGVTGDITDALGDGSSAVSMYPTKSSAIDPSPRASVMSPVTPR